MNSTNLADTDQKAILIQDEAAHEPQRQFELA